MDRNLDLYENSGDKVSVECEYANWEKPWNHRNINDQESQRSGAVYTLKHTNTDVLTSTMKLRHVLFHMTVVCIYTPLHVSQIGSKMYSKKSKVCK